MTLQSSGPISIADINVELGRASNALTTLNDAEVRSLLGKPTGNISLQDAYGKTAVFAFSITSNQNSLNLRTAAVNAGWNQLFKVVCTIESGVVIGSNTVDALIISGSFPRGVELINNGFIIGRGGTGGFGGDARGDQGPVISDDGRTSGIAYNGTSGGGGGTAVAATVPVTIRNNGTIGGGGGGGGGGGATIANQYVTSCGKDSCFTTLRRRAAAGGGGGGGGRSNISNITGGAGGIRVRGSTASIGSGLTITEAQAGGVGGFGSAGGGGFRGEEIDPGDAHAIAGWGGAGGNWGASGASGGGSEFWSPSFNQRTASGGSGGSGGLAVWGNQYITWAATGTRLGAIVNA
jgi:hypothetical protein